MIAVAQSGRVSRITLNRPEKRNALSVELANQLAQAIEGAAADRSVGAILVHGAGKSFCAGMDLAEMGKVDSDALFKTHDRLFHLGARLKKPLLMAVHGAALAGGTGLVANAHIAYAAPDATFGLTEIRLGLWPFVIYPSMAAAVGERRALELALTGRIFKADDALRWGLLHGVVAGEDVLDHASRVAGQIAGASPTAIAAGFAYLESLRAGQNDAKITKQTRDAVMGSADFEEGVKAFFDKRPPRWPSLES